MGLLEKLGSGLLPSFLSALYDAQDQESVKYWLIYLTGPNVKQTETQYIYIKKCNGENKDHFSYVRASIR